MILAPGCRAYNLKVASLLVTQLCKCSGHTDSKMTVVQGPVGVGPAFPGVCGTGRAHGAPVMAVHILILFMGAGGDVGVEPGMPQNLCLSHKSVYELDFTR